MSSGLERAGAAAGAAAAVTGAAVEAGSNSAAGRVETVPHVVETGENFWWISRRYYSSGRYYRALWKANEATHPDIKTLRVGDVIIIPPVEDLDPSLIDPPRRASTVDSNGSPRRSSVQGGGGGLRNEADLFAIASDSTSASRRDEAFAASRARSAVAATESVPVRRSSRTDPDLDLPPPEKVTRRGTRPDDHSSRVADRSLGGDDDAIAEEPAARTATRARTADSTSGKRSVYKIRPYDTLRSIARDMLGDSHRASEILDLNRDLIDDPSHLIVGQVIELPDDARPSVRRSARR